MIWMYQTENKGNFLKSVYVNKSIESGIDRVLMMPCMYFLWFKSALAIIMMIQDPIYGKGDRYNPQME